MSISAVSAVVRRFLWRTVLGILPSVLNDPLSFDFVVSPESASRLEQLWPTLSPEDCTVASSQAQEGFAPSSDVFSSELPSIAHLVYDAVASISLALDASGMSPAVAAALREGVIPGVLAEVLSN